MKGCDEASVLLFHCDERSHDCSSAEFCDVASEDSAEEGSADVFEDLVAEVAAGGGQLLGLCGAGDLHVGQPVRFC